MNAQTERRAWIFGTTAPALVFLLVIAYLPIAYAVMLSFFKKTAFNPAMTWVGLANYRYILEEPELWNAFWRSVVFTLGAVGLQLVWGLVAALLLNRAFRGPQRSCAACSCCRTCCRPSWSRSSSSGCSARSTASSTRS